MEDGRFIRSRMNGTNFPDTAGESPIGRVEAIRRDNRKTKLSDGAVCRVASEGRRQGFEKAYSAIGTVARFDSQV